MGIIQTKPHVIKDYEKLGAGIQEKIKLEYPYGFEDSLISFFNREHQKVSALPFETEEMCYLIRMSVAEAQQIIDDDEDFDEDGNLKDEIKDEYEEKHVSLDQAVNIADE